MNWTETLPTAAGIFWVRGGDPQEAFGVGIFSRVTGVPSRLNDGPHVYMPGQPYVDPLEPWSDELGREGPVEFIGPLQPPRAAGFWSEDLPTRSGHYWVRGGGLSHVVFVQIVTVSTEGHEPDDTLYVFLPGMEGGHPLEHFGNIERMQGQDPLEFAGPVSPPN